MSDEAKAERLASINEAIARGGGIISFSRKLGLSHQSVTRWRQTGYIPLDRAVTIEQMFGISRRRVVHPDVLRALETPESDGDVIL